MSSAMSSVAEEALVDDDFSAPGSRRLFLKTELVTCANLAWPLLVSFFSRMAMASVDSAFVGHIPSDAAHPGQYLAACVLADMSVSLLILPPLAFNQSLNALGETFPFLGEYPWIYGLIMSVLVGIVIIGGITRIAKTAEKIVPVMVGIYVIASLYILVTNAGAIPSALVTRM